MQLTATVAMRSWWFVSIFSIEAESISMDIVSQISSRQNYVSIANVYRKLDTHIWADDSCNDRSRDNNASNTKTCYNQETPKRIKIVDTSTCKRANT